MLKEGPLGEFIGLVDSGGGRRPAGLNNRRNDGGSRQQTGSSRQQQNQERDRSERPTVCSVLPPRGPMCDRRHGSVGRFLGPCDVPSPGVRHWLQHSR